MTSSFWIWFAIGAGAFLLVLLAVYAARRALAAKRSEPVAAQAREPTQLLDEPRVTLVAPQDPPAEAVTLLGGETAGQPPPPAPAPAPPPAPERERPPFTELAELTEARQTIAALRAQLARADADVAAADREAQRERAETARFESMVDQRDATIARLESEIARLKAELARVKR